MPLPQFISSEELLSRIEKMESEEEDTSIIIIDIELKSYVKEHVKFAVPIAADNFLNPDYVKTLDQKFEEIIIYCHCPYPPQPSIYAGSALTSFGVDNVKILESFYDWRASGYPMVYNTLKDATIYDIRDKNEYEDFHIPGSVNIDYEYLLSPDNQKNITPSVNVVISSDGHKGALAAEKLKKEGFYNFFNFTGGIMNWIEQGMPVDKKDNQ